MANSFCKTLRIFFIFKTIVLETKGAGKEEMLRSKITADIIVDQKYIKSDEKETGDIFTDLQEALNAASEGDTMFHYVANGLDVYRGSAPLIARNTYTTLAVPGLQDNLAFDIVKVNSGKVEDMEGSDIITLNTNVQEKDAAAAILRRKA